MTNQKGTCFVIVITFFISQAIDPPWHMLQVISFLAYPIFGPINVFDSMACHLDVFVCLYSTNVVIWNIKGIHLLDGGLLGVGL